MKVGIVGVGGVGRTLAQLLRAEAAIDSLLLIDKEENRVRFFTKMMGRVKGGASTPGCPTSWRGRPPTHSIPSKRSASGREVPRRFPATSRTSSRYTHERHFSRTCSRPPPRGPMEPFESGSL